LNLGNKAIVLNGLGLNDDGSGALVAQGGNTTTVGTGATAITYNTSPTVISVAAGTVLDLNAATAANTNVLIKRGSGELVYSGGTDNGSTGNVSVNEGTLTLNKTGTIRALRNSLTVTVDDLGNFDGVGAGTLRYGALAGTNNIEDSVTVTVNHQG